jgi:O-acetyl-ADP-ribose deacetylase (regulator of RNase III)
MGQLHYQTGDIFEAQTQVIVNTVNCQGVMGKGLALAFKQRYPAMFPVYQQECKTGKLRIGRPTLYTKSSPWILNFPTKNTWKANSKIEYLEQGLEYFVANYKKAGITSISFPKLGAQNGKLSWDDVGPLMAKYLGELDIEIHIYVTAEDQQYQPVDSSKAVEVWKQFNALPLEALITEVKLSKKEAKKLLEIRESMDLRSVTDLPVEQLAQVTVKRIRDYINSQLDIYNTLPGMLSVHKLEQNQSEKKTKKRVSKARSTQVQLAAEQASKSQLVLF